MNTNMQILHAQNSLTSTNLEDVSNTCKKG